MSIARFTGRGVVLFYRGFVDLGCGVTGSLMLSQALYWDQNEAAQKRGGWFYKTQEEWTKETGLTRREQETARKRLKELGFIEEKRQGVPAKIWFRVCTNKIDASVHSSMAESDNLDCTNQPILNGGISQSITEITTENTTETTSDIKQHVQSAVDEAFEHFWLNMALSKKNKAKAKQVFAKQVKDLKVEPKFFADQLIEDTKRRKDDFGFDRLHPTTYLNNHRWEDELDKPSQQQPQTRQDKYDQEMDALLDQQFQQRGLL